MLDELVSYIDAEGGVAYSSQLKGAGFSAGLISYVSEAGHIDRISRGIYCTPDVFEDDFLVIGARWRKCIFSHNSALYLNGLSDRLPSAQSVTVPRGYNPVRLIEEFPGIQIHWVRPDVYELGATNIMTPSGNRVRCYKPERSIAELIRQRKLSGVDAQLMRDAIGGYFNSREKDIHELARICEVLGVRRELQVYLEVLQL
ncbi:MAG: type IV toxin-antitoxin system AbiEi family antitoxin domain-containing protein [Actinomyces graevenitzii]|nr:type IV toxin-antitoxin system AbiEi family antitoxin domain-containing protein [Actinomyces graevenitzii]